MTTKTNDYFKSPESRARSVTTAQQPRAKGDRRPPSSSKGNLALLPVGQAGEEIDAFRRAVQDWLEACRANGHSPKTLEDYSSKLHKFWWWWREHTRYSDTLGPGPEHVTVKEARLFVGYLRTPVAFRWGNRTPTNNKDSRELSPASIAAYGRTIKAFFNWCANEGYIEDTPFKKSVKFGAGSGRDRDRTIKRLENDQLGELFAFLMQPARLDTFTGKRDLAMFAVLLDCGIRRGELLGISIADVDMVHNRITVAGKTGRRVVSFDQACKVALRAYIQAREDNNPRGWPSLWLTNDGEPLQYESFSSIVRRLEKAAGVDFHAHMLRHTFASILAEKEIDIYSLKELMGHESITTTQVYLRLNPNRLQEAHRSRSPLGGLPVVSNVMKRRPGRPRKGQGKEGE